MDSATTSCARPLFYATAFCWLLKYGTHHGESNIQPRTKMLDRLFIQIIDNQRCAPGILAFFLGGCFIGHQEVVGCLNIVIRHISNLVAYWENNVMRGNQNA
jgi:hypothetical protein